MLRSILLALALLAGPAADAAEPRSAFGGHREAAEFGLRVVLGTPLGTTDPARDCVQMLGGGQRAEQAARGSAGRAVEGEFARFIERGYRDAAQFCLMSAHLACRSAEAGARGTWPSPEHCATVRSLRARYGS
jgi:hypothetical protein